MDIRTIRSGCYASQLAFALIFLAISPRIPGGSTKQASAVPINRKEVGIRWKKNYLSN